jgi:hypothetical protein
VVGSNGIILKTTSAGGIWESQTLGIPNDLYAVHFSQDAQTGYAVGHFGVILKTTDGGTWVEEKSAVRQFDGWTVGRLKATPNPFSEQTLIQYTLATPSPVRLSIYNISSQLVKTLAREVETPGLHARRWDGRDEQGRKVAAGVYFYRLQTQGYTETKKMILVR